MPESVTFDDLHEARVHRETPSSIPPERFFAAPADVTEPAVSWAFIPTNARRFGGILAGVGFLGTMVFAAGFLHQLVIGAPVFEELLKFGLALLLVTALRVQRPVPRVLLALLPGAAFGLFEHFVTYAAEPLWLFVDRVLFHAGASAASMAAYALVEPLRDVRVRWTATVPATLVHWLNNFLALVLGLGAAVAPAAENAAVAVAVILTVLVHALAWGFVVAAPRLSPVVERAWQKRVPERADEALTPADRTSLPRDPRAGPPWEDESP